MRSTNTGRRLRKREYQQNRRTAQAAIENVKAEQVWREKEDPREQAFLNQSMYARGLGKSSIAGQNKERLGLQQKLRNEALGRNLEIAEHNLALINRRWRFGKKFQWAQSADDILSLVGGGLTAYGMATGNTTIGGVGAGMSAAGGFQGNTGYQW